jgi:hypothetical protein
VAKRLAPFRIPAGVPTAIRRALKLGKPGRFLSTVKALQLHDLLTWESKQVRKTHQRLFAGLERARRGETRQRYLTALRETQRTAGRLQHGLSQLSDEFGFEPLPPIPSRDVVPVAPRETEPSPDYALEEEGALEIEIGVDYVEAEGWYHDQGHTSDVAFNARLFRRDGGPITESDARAAMLHLGDTGHLPDEIDVRTVTWQPWQMIGTKKKRYGTKSDLDNFRDILQRVGDSGLRIGLVKPDEL